MWLVETSVVKIFRATAITVWPVLLVAPGKIPVAILTHEGVHAKQQRRWFVWGLGVGLLVWHLLYLLALPVGWNPWRAKWEREAYRANGFSDETISRMLRKPPYYLWWRQ